MEYLTKGDGQPSPKLKDYLFKDVQDIVNYYHKMLFYMRRLYQECRLVHADLSEYNSIVHKDNLYIIDVSQSVEPEHPMALDFLRMDIKNVNDFFSRSKINVYPERLIFRFITSEGHLLGIADNSDQELEKYLETLPLKTEDDQEVEDEIFRSLHLVRSLNNLDERDFQKFSEGKVDTMKDLVAMKEGEVASPGLQTANGNEVDSSEDEHNEDVSEEEEESSSEDDDDEEEEVDGISEKEWVEREQNAPRGKKYEDKDEKKARKEAAKLAKQEKRKTKMKKHIKKKIINKHKTGK